MMRIDWKWIKKHKWRRWWWTFLLLLLSSFLRSAFICQKYVWLCFFLFASKKDNFNLQHYCRFDRVETDFRMGHRMFNSLLCICSVRVWAHKTVRTRIADTNNHPTRYRFFYQFSISRIVLRILSALSVMSWLGLMLADTNYWFQRSVYVPFA